MDGHRLAVILTTMSREHSKRGETACRTKEAVVLETTDHRGVRDHVHQDQFSDARRTTHHSHAYRAPSRYWQCRHSPCYAAVTRYAVDNPCSGLPWAERRGSEAL